MRQGWAGRWAGWVVLGWLAPLAWGDEPLAMGTLSGRLVDPDGRPVAGGRVATDLDLEVDGRDGRVVAESDAEGRFRLGPLKPAFRSHYLLTFEAAGLVATRTLSRAYTVYPGADHDLGAIPLERGRVFTGRVLDADGTPRAGATVVAHVGRQVRGHSGGDAYPATTVRADDEGRFRTEPLPVGRLGLVVEAPGRRPAVCNTSIRPGGAEDVGDLKLEPGVAVRGFVRDEDGRPVAGANIRVRGRSYLSDDRGAFTIDQLAPNSSFQVNALKRGYGLGSGLVAISEAGIASRFERGAALGPPLPELIVPLHHAGTIRGAAVDVDTGAPVKLAQVLINTFTRDPDGTIVRVHAISAPQPQPTPGRYEASFAILPVGGEFQLVLSAEGYHDAEVVTPIIARLEPVDGVAVRMRRREAGSIPPIAHQAISGTVTRDGAPVRTGWVAAWTLAGPQNAPNSAVLRGRTVVESPVVAATAPIRDGVYDLDVPFPNDRLFVVVDEPGRPIGQEGPVALGAGEARRLDIALPPGGAIRGRVEGVPAEWRGSGYLVAFGRTGLLVEARLAADGTFALPPLPPGEYGLKAGHDAHQDAETYPGSALEKHPEAYSLPADPWKRAVRVTVEAGRDAGGVVVAWPE